MATMNGGALSVVCVLVSVNELMPLASVIVGCGVVILNNDATEHPFKSTMLSAEEKASTHASVNSWFAMQHDEFT
jgi:hypothetical protein